MVDVSEKVPTKRTAVAEASVIVPPYVARLLTPYLVFEKTSRKHGPSAKIVDVATERKGAIAATATAAGLLAVKNTPLLIPCCHPLLIDKADVTVRYDSVRRARGLSAALLSRVVVTCQVSTTHVTGVEMEALTGATVSALVVYDMLKSIPFAQQRGLRLGQARVVLKTGGKSDSSVRRRYSK